MIFPQIIGNSSTVKYPSVFQSRVQDESIAGDDHVSKILMTNILAYASQAITVMILKFNIKIAHQVSKASTDFQ